MNKFHWQVIELTFKSCIIDLRCHPPNGAVLNIACNPTIKTKHVFLSCCKRNCLVVYDPLNEQFFCNFFVAQALDTSCGLATCRSATFCAMVQQNYNKILLGNLPSVTGHQREVEGQKCKT